LIYNLQSFGTSIQGDDAQNSGVLKAYEAVEKFARLRPFLHNANIEKRVQ
jgi:hypothetical protein